MPCPSSHFGSYQIVTGCHFYGNTLPGDSLFTETHCLGTAWTAFLRNQPGLPGTTTRYLFILRETCFTSDSVPTVSGWLRKHFLKPGPGLPRDCRVVVVWSNRVVVSEKSGIRLRESRHLAETGRPSRPASNIKGAQLLSFLTAGEELQNRVRNAVSKHWKLQNRVYTLGLQKIRKFPSLTCFQIQKYLHRVQFTILCGHVMIT